MHLLPLNSFTICFPGICIYFVLFYMQPAAYISGIREGKKAGDFSSCTDGTPLKWFNWGRDRPLMDSEPNSCVRMRSGDNFTWADEVNCEMELPYICEYSKSNNCMNIVNRMMWY